MIKGLMLSIIITLTTNVYGQSITYDVLQKKNKVIGKLSVNVLVSQEITTYTIKSTTKLPLKARYSYELICSYKNNQLVKSSVLTYLNGKLRSSVQTIKDGDCYNIIEDGGSESCYEGEITYSEALIYVQEPTNYSKLYSDFTGSFKNITSVGDHKYKLHHPETGNNSIYKYENGQLELAVIEFGITNFSLRKR